MKTKRGICQICKKDKYLDGRKVCRICRFKIGTCRKCSVKRKIYVSGLCYLCYQDKQILKKLEGLEKDFKPVSEYNKYIFNLYSTYVKRYRLQYYHLKPTMGLKDLLECKPFPTVLSWKQVYDLSKEYKLFHSNYKKCGSAILKIGYMLQELGVLGPKAEEMGRRVESLFIKFDDITLAWVRPYFEAKLKTGRSTLVLLDHLKGLQLFNDWLKVNYDKSNLLLVKEHMIRQYLLSLEGHKLKYIRDVLGYLNSFYRWCKLNRIIMESPSKKIQLPREPYRLCVCSDEQIRQLFSFMKNSNSDPEEAFLLSLILFWGFTNEDLVHAKLSVHDNILQIHLRRKTLSSGKKYYNRKEVMPLPQKPKWFYCLQKRFYKKWLEHYKKTKNTYPNYSLVLPKHFHYNRPVSVELITKRIYSATIKATGIKIPPRVLRQTCGALYSKNNDASILSTLGWSTEFAFYYTWVPKIYFSESLNYNTKHVTNKSTIS